MGPSFGLWNYANPASKFCCDLKIYKLMQKVHLAVEPQIASNEKITF